MREIIGLLLAGWAGSIGMQSIMRGLNKIYDVIERRAYWKIRCTAIFLTALMGLLMIGFFSLKGLPSAWIGLIQWSVLAAAFFLYFALIYHFGPDTQQKFRFITTGSAFGTFILMGVSLVFKFALITVGQFNAAIGNLGAALIGMAWFYIMGRMIILGSEINYVFSPLIWNDF